MVEKFIPLSVPHIGGNEWKYVKECLDTGWVSSTGPFVGRFEKAVAGVVRANHAVAVVNGTAALHTALLIIGVKPGEEVLVSDLTFVAPVNAIYYAGAHPVMMDADPETWQIDTAKVEQFLNEECERRQGGCFNKKTGRHVSAILPVHILGLACDMDKIIALAKQFCLKVVEDSAEAMGVCYKGRHVGTFGDVSAFSFNGNKVLTTGGGGMVVTSEKAMADYARYLTTQAKDNPLEYIHNEIGYNYRLTNLQAAMGLAQLEKLDVFLAKKRSIASFYKEALRDRSDITLMPEPSYCEPTYWLYTVLLDEKSTLEDRKRVLKSLHALGIEARPFWHPIHALPPYQKEIAFDIRHAIRLYERGVCLPSSVGLEVGDLQRVVDALKKSL